MFVPDNLITLATHGTKEVPRFLQKNVRLSEDEADHFSDYATWFLLDQIPAEQKVRPRFGRIAGDPNRAPDAHDLFRDEDFKGQFLWHQALDDSAKEQLLELSYRPYHMAVHNLLTANYGHANDRLLVADVHDYPSRYDLPLIVISDYDGHAARSSVMEDLRQAFINRLGLSDHEVQLNTHYKGGFVTQYYGDIENPYLSHAEHDRDVVQIEINRLFYMDPNTEEINEAGLADFTEALTSVLAEVAYAQKHAPADADSFVVEREATLALQ